MNTNEPISPEQIELLLRDASRDVYNGLLDGCVRARDYFGELGLPLNRPLAANIARYHAKQYVATRRSIGTAYLLKDAPNICGKRNRF